MSVCYPFKERVKNLPFLTFATLISVSIFGLAFFTNFSGGREYLRRSAGTFPTGASGSTARARMAWLTRWMIGEYKSASRGGNRSGAYSAGFLQSSISPCTSNTRVNYLPFLVLVKSRKVHGIHEFTHCFFELVVREQSMFG